MSWYIRWPRRELLEESKHRLNRQRSFLDLLAKMTAALRAKLITEILERAYDRLQ